MGRILFNSVRLSISMLLSLIAQAVQPELDQLNSHIPNCQEYLERDFFNPAVYQKAFFERRLTADERQKLWARSDEISLVDQISEAVRSNKLGNALINFHLGVSPDASVRATYSAYRQGRIPFEALITLILRWEAYDDWGRGPLAAGPIQLSPLLDRRGKITPLCREIFFPPGTSAEVETVERFEFLIRRLYPFEQNVAVIPLSQRGLEEYGPPPPLGSPSASRESVMTADPTSKEWLAVHLANIAGSDSAPFFVLKKRFLIPIPSFSSWRAYFTARFGANAVTLTPELGFANEMQLIGGLSRGGRILALAYPNIKSSLRADGRWGKYLVTYHDIMHAYEAQGLYPLSFRRLLGRYFQLLALNDWWSFHKHAVGAFTDLHLQGIISSRADSSQEIAEALVQFIKVYGFRAPAPPHLGAIQNPLALVVQDMQKNPEIYTAMGLRPELMMKLFDIILANE